MAKDVRALREEAAEATASGKYKRALAAYLELERLEPRDAQWAKRAGETYRRLGNNKHAIEAFERSADRYAQNGFLVQAIAVCKLVLGIDPNHAEALRRLSQMNEQLGAGPTRAGGMAENNPGLHENPNVAVLRRPPGTTVNPRSKPASSQRSAYIKDPPSGRVVTKAPDTRSQPVAKDPRAAATPTSTPSSRATPRGGNPAIPSSRTTPPGGNVAIPSSRVTPPGGNPVMPSSRLTPPGGNPAIPRRDSRPIAVVSPPVSTRPGPTPIPVIRDVPSASGTGSNTVPRQPIITPVPQPIVRPSVSRTKTPQRPRNSTPQHLAMPRTKSKPIALPPGAAINDVTLANEMPEAHPRDESNPGVHIIPIDDEVTLSENLDTYDFDRVSAPVIEVEPPDEQIYAEIDDVNELELDDIEEIPLPEPLYMGAAAHKALQATPLFAGLPSDALEALVENLTLVHLEPKEALFHEGDPGDALYVIVEGEVSVQAEGPPRVEMARLGAGAFLGEVALMTDQPRSATVVAISPAELLRIDRHTLSRVLANHGDVLRAVLRFVRDRLVDRWMRTSPLFRPFDEQQRAELASKFNFLEIEDGTRLIDAGTRPDGLYIVLAGQFVVQRGNSTLATLGAGELIGETALLSGGNFKSNVTSRGKSLALHLPAGEFREIIMTHPHVLEYIGEQAEHSRRLQIL